MSNKHTEEERGIDTVDIAAKAQSHSSYIEKHTRPNETKEADKTTRASK